MSDSNDKELIVREIESSYSRYGLEDDREKRLELYNSFEDFSNEEICESLLTNAVLNGDVEALSFLIDKGLDTSFTNDYEENLLHVLAEHDKKIRHIIPKGEVYACTKALLDSGVSALKKNGTGDTSIHLAANTGLHEFLKALIDENKKIDFTNKNGETALHKACTFATLCSDPFFTHTLPNYEEIMAKPDNEEDYRLKMRKEDIQKEHDSEKEKVDNFYTFIKFLMDAGLDPDQKNNDGKTPKDLAGKCKDLRIAGVLNGIDVENVPSDDKDTELQLKTKGLNIVQAITNSDLEALEALLKLGHNPNDPYDTSENSLNGIQVKNKTPLGIACSMVSADSISLLLAYGANPNEKDPDGKIALTYLFTSSADIRGSRKEILKTKVIDNMMEEMKKSGLIIDESVDEIGNTLLNIACANIDRFGITENQSLPKKIIQVLIKMKADPNKANNSGVTPLMSICKGNIRLVEDLQITLLEAGANIDAKDENGNTPLMYAAGNENKAFASSMVDMLFSFGNPEINAVNNEDKSALEIATEKNNEPLVNYLLMKM